MKRRFAFIWISLGLWLFVSSRGGTHPLLDIADSLMASGEYQAAATEYQRYLFFHPRADNQADVRFRQANALYQSSEISAAFQACQEAIERCSSVASRTNWELRLCRWNIEQGHNQMAARRLTEMTDRDLRPSQQNQALLMLFLLHLESENWDVAHDCLSQLAFDDSTRIRSQQETMKRLRTPPRGRSVSTAQWLSTFIPGAGQIYAGQWKAGLNAYILNGALAFGESQFILQEKYTGSLLWGWLLWYRYYSGNRYHAARLVREANRQQVLIFKKQVLENIRPLFQNEDKN